MEEVQEILEKGNYSKKTQEYIIMFINAFVNTYGDYITKEELAKRIVRNLDSDIEFSDNFDQKTAGTYKPISKKIEISSSVQEKENVMIHELIHCITRYKPQNRYC